MKKFQLRKNQLNALNSEAESPQPLGYSFKFFEAFKHSSTYPELLKTVLVNGVIDAKGMYDLLSLVKTHSSDANVSLSPTSLGFIMATFTLLRFVDFVVKKSVDQDVEKIDAAISKIPSPPLSPFNPLPLRNSNLNSSSSSNSSSDSSIEPASF